MRFRRVPLVLGLAIVAVAFSPNDFAHARGHDAGDGAARAQVAKALARGDLDSVRVAWTVWPTREIWETVEVKRGRLYHAGGQLKGAKRQRPLADGEKQALLQALRAARPEKLVWIDRDVKNDGDRVLNVDFLPPGDGEPLAIRAFVRSGSAWRTGATAPLAALLEQWLQEK